MNVRHAGLDELAELKWLSVLGDLDFPHLAGPGVEILKEVSMNGAKMREIEVAERGAFRDPLGDQLTLDRLQASGVEDVQTVPQNGRSWVDVRIVLARSAGTGVTLAKMWARRRACDQASRSNNSNMAI